MNPCTRFNHIIHAWGNLCMFVRVFLNSRLVTMHYLSFDLLSHLCCRWNKPLHCVASEVELFFLISNFLLVHIDLTAILYFDFGLSPILAISWHACIRWLNLYVKMLIFLSTHNLPTDEFFLTTMFSFYNVYLIFRNKCRKTKPIVRKSDRKKTKSEFQVVRTR